MFALNTLQATKYLWLEYNNCMAATAAISIDFVFSVSEVVTLDLCLCDVPQPKAPNYCQGLSVDL